jgi:hypothetical protein
MQLGFYVAVLASIFIGTRLVMRQIDAATPPRRVTAS